MSMIDYEITYPSSPRFVFHDSHGIEAGAESGPHGTADDTCKLRMEYIQMDTLDLDDPNDFEMLLIQAYAVFGLFLFLSARDAMIAKYLDNVYTSVRGYW